MRIVIGTIEEGERPWAASLLTARWGSPRIVTRGRVHEADRLPAFVARRGRERIGLLTYRIDGESCEVVSLDSTREGEGVGSALLAAAAAVAREAGCRRLWLVTTNDNVRALRFYQRRGFRLRALHAGAIDEARLQKPEIPRKGIDGITLRDEIELDVPPAELAPPDRS